MGRHPLSAAVLAVALSGPGSLFAQGSASARQIYDRAVELQARGDHPAALALLWEAAALAPDDADVQNGLGEALDRLGALDAAIEAFRRAADRRHGFRRAENNLVLTLVKAGRGPEAVDRARRLAAAAPDDAEAQFTLGLAQSEQDVQAAIRTLTRVLDLAPRHTLARYNLALALKRQDRLAEAIDELRRAIAIEPRAEAHYALGVIYWHQGEPDRAARELRAAIAIEPRYADAHHTLGAVLQAQREWAGAAASLRRAIALRPDLWGAHDTLARVLQQAGDAAAARAHAAESERLRLLTQREQAAGVWTSVGTRRLDAGDLLDALDCFRRATAAFDGYAPAHYQMGRTLRRLGDEPAAQAAFARAQRLNPSLRAPAGR